MPHLLQQPYPFEQSLDRRLLTSVAVGLFVAIFLVVFKPFGISQLPPARQWQPAILFGAISFCCSAFFRVLLPLLFPKNFDERVWRTWKEALLMLITVLSISAGVYGGLFLLYGETTPFPDFLHALLITLQVGIFPILAIVAVKQIVLYKRYAAAAATVTSEAPPKDEFTSIETPAQVSGLIELRGDGQKEILTCAADALRYIESSDNYINIHHVQNGKEQTALFRGSLRKMEEQLAEYEQFFRCHRMYIVNLENVLEVTGNAQGLKLHLRDSTEPVPVSRSLTTHVKTRLQALSRLPQNA